MERRVGMNGALPTIPLSTYRLQFSPRFRFTDAAAVLPYLAQLGIEAIYASPYLRARPGSEHGYDVVDHNALNPEIGSAEEYAEFIQASQALGISQILDFVPNHMGIGGIVNPWWSDVLEWGERSRYAKYFDIDWRPQREDLIGKVLLPFLGEQYGTVLEEGLLSLTFDRGTFAVAYYGQRYPLAPATYAPLLSMAADLAVTPAAEMLADLAVGFAGMQEQAIESTSIDDVAAQTDALKARLGSLAAEDANAASAIERALLHWRVQNKDEAAIERLDALIHRQHYRLSSWRVSLHEINYRRFFDVNELAGLRVEDADVLAETHRLVFQMLADGRVQGLRIDHVDGLFNPQAYCRLIRERSLVLRQPLYLIVEKILARFESLRDDWGIDGTTGYDFMNAVNGLFVNARSELAFDRMYANFAPTDEPYDAVLYASKQHIIRNKLASDLTLLSNAAYRIARSDRRSSDFTYDGLRDALAQVVGSFPVYRTYITAEGIGQEDRHFIDWAIAQARKRSDILGDGIFTFLHSLLTTDINSVPRTHYDPAAVLAFVMRFQQFTGPVMAKSSEDTAFYRYVRLLSLNEVGGDPRRFGTTVAAFHRDNQQRADRFPHAMLATSTHDHKRGEDTRLRIDALSEMPGRWGRALRVFERLSDTRSFVDSERAPSRNDAYALYQTIVGTWPARWLRGEPESAEVEAYVLRLQAWMRKAIREAKLHSSWTHPNAAYEEASLAFVRRLFEDRASIFMRDMRALVSEVGTVAMISSLSQTTLKLTSPGVPDLYQGSELWDLSLVDPDNRRDVDFAYRAAELSAMQQRFASEGDALELCRELLTSWHDGKIKLFTLWRLLAHRKTHASTFRSASYRTLAVVGRNAERIVAFARGDSIVVVPRLVYPLVRSGDGEAPRVEFENAAVVLPSRTARRWRNIFTNTTVEIPQSGSRGRLAASELFAHLPVAVLAAD